MEQIVLSDALQGILLSDASCAMSNAERSPPYTIWAGLNGKIATLVKMTDDADDPGTTPFKVIFLFDLDSSTIVNRGLPRQHHP